MRGSCAWLISQLEDVKMPKPYAEDLRRRMIFQRLSYERSYVAIASQLFVFPETVQRTISTFLSTGVVKPCNIGRPTGGLHFISS